MCNPTTVTYSTQLRRQSQAVLLPIWPVFMLDFRFKGLLAHKSIVLMPVFPDRFANIAVPVSIEMPFVEVRGASAVGLALALTVLLVTVGGIQGARCACERKRIVVLYQS